MVFRPDSYIRSRHIFLFSHRHICRKQLVILSLQLNSTWNSEAPRKKRFKTRWILEGTVRVDVMVLPDSDDAFVSLHDMPKLGLSNKKWLPTSLALAPRIPVTWRLITAYNILEDDDVRRPFACPCERASFIQIRRAISPFASGSSMETETFSEVLSRLQCNRGLVTSFDLDLAAPSGEIRHASCQSTVVVCARPSTVCNISY
jgi:hypothetical protein